MEYFDLRNPDGSITGAVKERSLVHRDGDLHGTVHTFILRKWNDKLQMLLQKRSANKDAFPGCYDISSAGHVSAGQDYMEAALRELEEELSIQAQKEQLHFIGYHTGYSEEKFHGKPFRNHEISAVYLYLEPVDAEKLTLQEEELESVCWMDFEICKERCACGDPLYCLFLDELEMAEEAYTLFTRGLTSHTNS